MESYRPRDLDEELYRRWVKLDSTLNILVSSSIFPNNRETTKGIYLLKQAQALSKHCNVKVIAPIPYFPAWIQSEKYGIYSKIRKNENTEGIEVLHPRVVIVPKLARILHGFLYVLFLFHPMRKIKQTFDPDIIVCFWVYPDGFANVLLAKLLRIPIIVGGLGCDINDLHTHKIQKAMVLWALRRSDRVLAISHAMKRTMLELGIPDNKIRIVPNGVDDNFAPMDKGIARDSIDYMTQDKSAKTILYCGRFSSEKGIQDLIMAVKILRDKGLFFRLLMVGDGPQKKQIIQTVKSLKLDNLVDFYNEVPPHKIPYVMNSADLLCLPSKREGWPNVVMEALACGLPVVASQVGGVPEILTSSDYGIMVPHANPRSLADGLSLAMEKSWDREKIRNAVKHRSWDTVAKDILNIITMVLG